MVHDASCGPACFATRGGNTLALFVLPARVSSYGLGGLDSWIPAFLYSSSVSFPFSRLFPSSPSLSLPLLSPLLCCFLFPSLSVFFLCSPCCWSFSLFSSFSFLPPFLSILLPPTFSSPPPSIFPLHLSFSLFSPLFFFPLLPLFFSVPFILFPLFPTPSSRAFVLSTLRGNLEACPRHPKKC